MKKILLLLCCSAVFSAAISQNGPYKKPEVIPKSPEAAAFARYGEVPVSKFSGVPDISIPLHTVKIGNISLPIDVRYHAGGIQVSQEATVVGLGWDINVGGSIRYVPVGANDITTKPGVLQWSDLNDVITYVTQVFGGGSVPAFGHEDHPFLDNTVSHVCKTRSDVLGILDLGLGEQDFFIANFFGNSFSFFLHPSNQAPIFYGQKSKCKIEIGSPGIAQGFTITGEDGTKYYFKALEQTWSSSGFWSPQNWWLSGIESTDGNLVELTYETTGTTEAIPDLSDTHTQSGICEVTPCGRGRNISSQNALIYPMVLKQIKTRNEIVTFDYDSNRPDIKGAGARRLIDIKVTSSISNKIVEQFNFEYDWFVGALMGGNYLDDDIFFGKNHDNKGFSIDNLSKRLKLTKIKKVDPLNSSQAAEVYAFSYDDAKPLPYKTSFSRDFWGYFNGQENRIAAIPPIYENHTLLPDLRDLISSITADNILSPPDTLFRIPRANRSVSTQYINRGMLKSITYPTGGRTEFEFESNTIDNYKFLSVEDKPKVYLSQQHIVYDFNNSYGVPSKTITITSKVRARFYGGISTIGNLTPQQIVGASAAIFNVDPTKNFNVSFWVAPPARNIFFDKWIDLEPGTYILTCNSPDELGSLGYGPPVASANLDFDYIDRNYYNSAQSVGNGLRVKSIKQIDVDGTTLLQTAYSYKNGKMLTPIRFYDQKAQGYYKLGSVGQGGSDGVSEYQLRGSAVSTLNSDNIFQSTLIAGPAFGYDSTSEEYIGIEKNGKTVSIFNNDPYQLYFGVRPNIKATGFTNGKIKSEVTLNSTNDTIRVEKTSYSKLSVEDNSTFVSAFSHNYIIGTIPTGFLDHIDTSPSWFYELYSYPLCNYWGYILKKTTVDYFASDKITSTSEYDYNSSNFSISKEKQYRSDGKSKEVNYQYPADFSSNTTYTKMAQLNMVNSIVATTETIDGTQTTKTTTNYSDIVTSFPTAKNFIKPGSVALQHGSLASEDRLIFDSYDDKGNVLTVHNSNDVYTSYIWGYNQSCPVVKIEGKSTSLIDNALKTAIANRTFSNGLNFTDTEIKADVAWLKTQLSALLNDKSYMVTFYTYAIGVGMTSQTDPNGFTTYFEYDSFGRLKLIRDNDGKILSQYQYHYNVH